MLLKDCKKGLRVKGQICNSHEWYSGVIHHIESNRVLVVFDKPFNKGHAADFKNKNRTDCWWFGWSWEHLSNLKMEKANVNRCCKATAIHGRKGAK